MIYKKNEIDKIVNLLKRNKIIAIKTDTVFGLMALASKENELRINKLKGSPLDKKISIIFDSVDTVLNKLDLSLEKEKLIKSKLPGKYTFVVKMDLSKLGFDRMDFGIRVTTLDYLQEIIKKTGPLLASSCNKSGNSPCTKVKEIEKYFDIDIVEDEVIDNKPSTIIDIRDEIKIIRD